MAEGIHTEVNKAQILDNCKMRLPPPERKLLLPAFVSRHCCAITWSVKGVLNLPIVAEHLCKFPREFRPEGILQTQVCFRIPGASRRCLRRVTVSGKSQIDSGSRDQQFARSNPEDGMRPDKVLGLAVETPFSRVGSRLKWSLFKVCLEEAFVGFHPLTSTGAVKQSSTAQ